MSARFRSFTARLVKDYLSDEIARLDHEESLSGQLGDLAPMTMADTATPSHMSPAPMSLSGGDGGPSIEESPSATPLLPPWIRYPGCITEDQWETFKAARLTPEARVIPKDLCQFII